MMHIVLFVCVENTFRSIMAEAIFNAKAPAGWGAESAGVQPATAINPVVITLLREIGIEVESKRPRRVTSDMTERAWRVITFGCLDRCPPRTKGKSEDWPVPGSTGRTDAQLKTIRNDLTRRVESLIQEIEGFKP
jgi:arsenate reductase